MNKMRKVFGMPLKPSKAQLAEIEEMHAEERRKADELARKAALEAETDWHIKRLRHLAALGIQPIIAFCNIKSGSKTTAALYVGSLIAEYTRKNVVALPATHNSATSTLAAMAGIAEGETITISEYSNDIDEFGVYRTLSQRVPRTEFGLGVISEDPNSTIDEENGTEAVQREAYDTFDKVIRTTLPNVDVLLLDLGNDNIERYNIALSAARFADVLNLVALKTATYSKLTMRKTFTGYSTGKALDLPENKEPLPGERFSPSDKVLASNLIMSGVGLGETIDFDELTRPPEQMMHAPDQVRWHGHGFCVPYDPYIAREDGSVCDITKIMPETKLAFLRIAVASFEKAAWSQHINTGADPHLQRRTPQRSPSNSSQFQPSEHSEGKLALEESWQQPPALEPAPRHGEAQGMVYAYPSLTPVPQQYGSTPVGSTANGHFVSDIWHNRPDHPEGSAS
jgi:hypothetical protein